MTGSVKMKNGLLYTISCYTISTKSPSRFFTEILNSVRTIMDTLISSNHHLTNFKPFENKKTASLTENYIGARL